MTETENQNYMSEDEEYLSSSESFMEFCDTNFKKKDNFKHAPVESI